jgi:DnaK suppressor protein
MGYLNLIFIYLIKFLEQFADKVPHLRDFTLTLKIGIGTKVALLSALIYVKPAYVLGGFVDKKKIQYFKELLLKQRQQILNVGLLNNSEDLHVSEEDLSDEMDLASSLIHQQLSCTIRDREYAKLRRIDFALEKISSGSFGHCEECEEEIGLKRLENQPWAELCITHAEEKEREQSQIWRQA